MKSSELTKGDIAEDLIAEVRALLKEDAPKGEVTIAAVEKSSSCTDRKATIRFADGRYLMVSIMDFRMGGA